mmetsp:Transcript_12615/g.23730  ORF Transcript_12615/g.23730 Transcript_12615/m.23730 type:complete len:150 (+) Transcript_12615:2-451(+)
MDSDSRAAKPAMMQQRMAFVKAQLDQLCAAADHIQAANSSIPVAWDRLLEDLSALQQQASETLDDMTDRQLGAYIASELQLEPRLKEFPDLRRRIKREGGICRLFKQAQLLSAVASSVPSTASDGSGSTRCSEFASGSRTPEWWPEPRR